jgi:hypothetical protein
MATAFLSTDHVPIPFVELIVYLAFSFDTWQRNLNARAVRVASWFTVIW